MASLWDMRVSMQSHTGMCERAARTSRVHDVSRDVLRVEIWWDGNFWYDMLDLCGTDGQWDASGIIYRDSHAGHMTP